LPDNLAFPQTLQTLDILHLQITDMYLIKHSSAPFQGIKIAECFNRSIDTISQSEIKSNKITPIYEKKDEKKD